MTVMSNIYDIFIKKLKKNIFFLISYYYKSIISFIFKCKCIVKIAKFFEKITNKIEIIESW